MSLQKTADQYMLEEAAVAMYWCSPDVTILTRFLVSPYDLMSSFDLLANCSHLSSNLGPTSFSSTSLGPAFLYTWCL